MTISTAVHSAPASEYLLRRPKTMTIDQRRKGQWPWRYEKYSLKLDLRVSLLCKSVCRPSGSQKATDELNMLRRKRMSRSTTFRFITENALAKAYAVSLFSFCALIIGDPNIRTTKVSLFILLLVVLLLYSFSNHLFGRPMSDHTTSCKGAEQQQF